MWMPGVSLAAEVTPCLRLAALRISLLAARAGPSGTKADTDAIPWGTVCLAGQGGAVLMPFLDYIPPGLLIRRGSH